MCTNSAKPQWLAGITGKDWILEKAKIIELEQVQQFVADLILMVEQVDVKALGALGGIIFFYKSRNIKSAKMCPKLVKLSWADNW